MTSATMPAAEHQSHVTAVLPPANRGGLRFDRRLLLVYGLLLLDVVVIGSTSLQHIWQPAILIDKVLQNHNTPMDAALLSHSVAPQYQLPVAVKRELGMSCCCGWLALAVMGTLSLLLSYSPSSGPANADASLSSSAIVQPKGQSSTAMRRSCPSTAHAKEAANTCSACSRTLDEVELQVKLKYLLVAVATFCVFFALNLVVQIHGRFQQSKMTVTALKTFAADNAEGSGDTPCSGLCEVRQDQQHPFNFHRKQQSQDDGQKISGSSAAAAASLPSSGAYRVEEPVVAAKGEAGAAGPREDDGLTHPQSPPYFYWRDFFFWAELSRECFFDGEVQLSGLWVLLHAAVLLGGRGVVRSRSAVLPRMK